MIRVQPQEVYDISLDPKEEMYLLVDVTAPSVCGKYAAFYQLTMGDGNAIGPVLEVMALVIILKVVLTIKFGTTVV